MLSRSAKKRQKALKEREEEDKMTMTEAPEVETQGTNGTEPATAPRTKKVRVDRAELGYSQAINDLRKLTRAGFSGQTKSDFNDLLDLLEDEREAGARIDRIVAKVRAEKQS